MPFTFNWNKKLIYIQTLFITGLVSGLIIAVYLFEESSTERRLIPYDEVSFTIIVLPFAILAFLSLVFLAASLVKLRNQMNQKDNIKNKLCHRLTKSSFEPLKLVFIFKKTSLL